jgi:hypothetical protein
LEADLDLVGVVDGQTALVQAYRQIADAYICHPDAKRLGPDEHICGDDTAGLLTPILRSSTSTKDRYRSC